MRFHVLASAVAVGLLTFSSAVPALAADGFWYFEVLNVDAAHQDGFTGDGVTIAVIDSPINTEVPTLADANIEVREPSFCYAADGSGPMPAKSTALTGQAGALHGTAVTSLIVGSGAGYNGGGGVKGVAPDAKVLYYTIFGSSDQGASNIECLDENGDESTDIALAEAMNEAMDAGATIIAVSSLQTPGPELYAAQIRAVNEGVIVVGGMPNTSDVVFSAGWPGQANGAVGVQAADSSGAIATTAGLPNTDDGTVVVAPGIGIAKQGSDTSWEDEELTNGTSLATPIVSGFLALVAQKYPDATGNQLLQTLIHNTGADDHELMLDATGAIGYGFVSATHMLRVDPSQYPDENPLILDSGIPTIAEFASGYEAGTEPTPSSTPSPSPTETTSDEQPRTPVGIIVGVGVGALVLVSVITLVFLLARRSRQSSDTGRGSSPGQ